MMKFVYGFVFLLFASSCAYSAVIDEGSGLSCDVLVSNTIRCVSSGPWPAVNDEVKVVTSYTFDAVRIQKRTIDHGYVCAIKKNIFLTPNTNICWKIITDYYYNIYLVNQAEDVDSDKDELMNAYDNCPANSNSDQRNSDYDSAGNVCDSMTLDSDNDGQADSADGDDDNDGVPDAVDLSPYNSGIKTERQLLLNKVYKGVAIEENTDK